MQVYIHELKQSFSLVTDKPEVGNFWSLDIPKGFEGWIIGVKNVDELLIYFIEDAPDTPVNFKVEIHDMEIKLPVKKFWNRSLINTEEAFDKCQDARDIAIKEFNRKLTALGKGNLKYRDNRLLGCEFVEFSSNNLKDAVGYFLCIHSGPRLPEKF